MGGISGILGTLALIGGVLFLAGIAIAVTSVSQGRNARGGAMLAVIGLVVGLLFGIISQGILIVEPTQVAVIFNTLTGKLEDPRLSGTSVVIPVIQTYYIYPISQQQYTMSGAETEGALRGNDAVQGRTIDGQEVALDITVLYSVNKDKVNDLHQRWQTGYQDNFVRPTVRGLVRDVVSGFRAEDIYGEKRTAMEDEMQAKIGERFNAEGLILTDLLVRDITFSDLFRQAIEQKQIADQEAQQAQLRVTQRENEANQLRAQAAGERDAEIARAQGDAQATILRAQAEAEALRLVSEQIAANPSLIQYLYVQNLSDNVNIALVPANSPFLFDFSSLAEPNSSFVAPAVPTPEPTPDATGNSGG
ncbi:MAG: prohibitin family protein [Anaerolineaceae bacterium]|nr:prohibitin family protein [Anaerolineaceae bacterium]